MSERDVSSFWDHLDVLRKVLFRCLIAWVIGAAAAFCFKTALFDLLFAPSRDDFISYRGLAWLCEKTGWQSLCPGNFEASFINTELAAQFMTHIKVALGAGLVVVSPYLLVQLYGFVAPALYDNEKRHAAPIIIWGTLLFVLGVLMNYFVIFPFAFRFLNNYQVYSEVHNQISLSSYISNLLMLSLSHRQLPLGQGRAAASRDLEEIPPPCHRGHRHRGGRHHPHRRRGDADTGDVTDIFTL